MARIILAAVVFLAACIHIPHSASAEERDVLRVQFSLMSPWKIGAKGKEQGVDIEFMRLLAERMDMRVEFVHVPFARGLVCMEEGSIDLMTGVLYREDRKDTLHFIQPAYHTFSPKAFYVLKDGGPAIRRFDDLAGLRIGTIIGSKYFEQFDNDARLRKDAVRNIRLNFRKLLEGRVDVVIYSETSGDVLVEALGLQNKVVKADYKYRRQNHVHMVLSKCSPHAHRLAEFNEHMQALVQEGAREKIKEQYGDLVSY